VPRYGRVVLGGTFDHLHVGHEAMLSTAFAAGRSVAIGLTTPSFLAAHPKPGEAKIQPFATRRRELTRWLAARYPRSRWAVVPLNDGFGRSVDDGVDALVVSADTLVGGQAVNAERQRRGRRPVPVLTVPLVLADDLRPVSSRRIRAGEIDRDGRRLGAIRVGLSVESTADRAPAAKGIRRAFPHARVVRVPFPRAQSRHYTRLDNALRAAVSGTELGVAVGATDRSHRAIVAGVGRVALPPRVIARPTPSLLTEAIARELRRSAAAKLFSEGPE
jgi:pantetheine-phosphate adenylyltransferase